MAQYTVELRNVCEIYGREEVENWFKDYNLSDFLTTEQINQIEKYNVWSKDRLATKIVDHYFMREIGLETPALFKHYAKVYMNEIMERKLPKIYSNFFEYDPLSSVDYTEEYTREIKNENSSNEKSNSTNSGTSNYTSNNNASELNVASDTPEGTVGKDAILSGTYASSTNASETESSITDETTSSNDTQTTIENYGDAKTLETYTHTMKGDNGVIVTNQYLIREYREIIVAVDEEIIKELSKLFMRDILKKKGNYIMSNLKELKPVNKVQDIISKFCYTIGMIPTSYKLGLTVEEQILAIGKYLEEAVIPALNNNAKAVVELQNLYIELKNYVDNYFDNLDVQDEINNKLDEMAQDGELQSIIYNYINAKALFCFDNVQNMKDASNLIDGSYAKTLGFYSIKDGGEALYKIRTKTSTDTIDNMSLFTMSNNKNLVAEFIPNFSQVNVKQLGAKGDNQTDDTNSIKKAFEYDIPVYFPKSSGNYIISSRIDIHTSFKMDNFVKMNITDGSQEKVVFRILNYNEQKPIVIENPLIDAGWNSVDETSEFAHCILINSSSNIFINGGHLKNALGDCLTITGGNPESENPISKNIRVNGTILENPRRCCIAVISAEDCIFSNLICKKSHHYVAMIDIEPNAGFTGTHIDNLIFDNIQAYCDRSYSFNILSGMPVSNVTIKNCDLYNGYLGFIRCLGNDHNESKNKNIRFINNNLHKLQNAESSLYSLGDINNTDYFEFSGNTYNETNACSLGLYCNSNNTNLIINNNFIKVYNESASSQGFLLKASKNVEFINNIIDILLLNSDGGNSGCCSVTAENCKILNNTFLNVFNGITLLGDTIIKSLIIANNIFETNKVNEYYQANSYGITFKSSDYSNIIINAFNNIFNGITASHIVRKKPGETFDLPAIPFGLSKKRIYNVINTSYFSQLQVNVGDIAFIDTPSSNNYAYIYTSDGWKALPAYTT